MAICKAGQSAFNDWGDEAILSEEFLIKDHQTWETGKVSINHENNNALLGKATIKDIEYGPETQLVWAFFPDLPDKAKDLINSEFYEGLSQECVPLEMDGNKIIKGYGLGVTIVTYPYKPAATPEMGVGVRPTASMFAAVASKYPEYKTGGEKTPEDEPTIDELKSTIDTLKSENAKLREDLEAKDKTMESTVEKAVKAALESHDKTNKEASEYNEAVKELSSFMKPEDLEGFLSSKPAAGIIRATAAAMKATVASHIGTDGGSGGGKSGSGKVQSIYESGKEIYESAGVTLEDLEKYGEIEE